MTVVPGGAAGTARTGDGLTLGYVVTGGNQYTGVMAVIGHFAVAVVDYDQIAIAPIGSCGGTREHYRASVCRQDGGAVGHRDV